MQEVKSHTALEQHVIKTLLYYDIFTYPLNGNEVLQFLGVNSVSEKDVIRSLDNLAEQRYISKFGEYYSLQREEANVIRRIKGNREAQKYLPLAESRARFISRFPFVRAVLASGSLSKNYMDENSDLDFFIVTSPGRLWISRTLLVLYKRLFLGNSHKHFCVNYFIDADHLEIEEKNLFTAIELATVIPLFGAEFYHQLQEKNKSWLIRFFPNFKPRTTETVPLFRESISRKIIETIINLFFGNWGERKFMTLTQNRWKQLYEKNYSSEDFTIAFKTKKHVSKNHPRHFQKKVMDLYRKKIDEFNKRFDFDLK